MITWLIDLAKHLRDVRKQGQALGLSPEEVAFCDALAENGLAREVMKNDRLRLMAREPAGMATARAQFDWSQRESVRGGQRRQVKRAPVRFCYPPDLSEDATQLVLKLSRSIDAAWPSCASACVTDIPRISLR